MLTGGRLTWEESYAYAKFARTALGTNDIDFRVRAHSAEETRFLGARIAGNRMSVTYSDLEKAPVVLLAGFEPEEESPLIFLRLRKAVRTRGTTVLSVASHASRGLQKMSGTLLDCVPGGETGVLDDLRTGAHPELGTQLRRDGTIIMVGERLATAPGA